MIDSVRIHHFIMQSNEIYSVLNWAIVAQFIFP